MRCAFPVSITHDPFTLRHLTCVHSLLLIFTDLKRFYFFTKTFGALLVKKKKKEISNPGMRCQETLRFKSTSAVPLFSIFMENWFEMAFAVVSNNDVFQKSVLFAHIAGSCNISPSKNIILIFHNFPLAIDGRSTDRLHLICVLCVCIQHQHTRTSAHCVVQHNDNSQWSYLQHLCH